MGVADYSRHCRKHRSRQLTALIFFQQKKNGFVQRCPDYSGDCRCVSFFPDGYDSFTAAKLRNGFEICKLFEPRRANLRHEAVFDGFQ